MYRYDVHIINWNTIHCWKYAFLFAFFPSHYINGPDFPVPKLLKACPRLQCWFKPSFWQSFAWSLAPSTSEWTSIAERIGTVQMTSVAETLWHEEKPRLWMSKLGLCSLCFVNVSYFYKLLQTFSNSQDPKQIKDVIKIINSREKLHKKL